MAHIRNRSNDPNAPAWEARVRIKGYPCKTATFETRKEAEDWAAGVERPMRRRTYRDDAAAHEMTLKAALDKYEVEVTPLKKGATAERYVIATWRRDELANRSLASITSSDIAAWRNERVGEDKAPSTIANHMNLISAIYVHAASEWHMGGLNNPVSGVKRPKPRPGRKRRLEGDEETRLLDACRALPFPWLAPLVLLAIETGMRQGEIRTLVWSGIKGRTVHLPDTKNGEPRTVPLSSRAVAALEEMRRMRRNEDEVFPATKDQTSLAFRAACKAAGIVGLTFHDLRHEATTRLSKKLPNVLELSAVTGHKTLSMLKRYYQPDTEELAQKLG